MIDSMDIFSVDMVSVEDGSMGDGAKDNNSMDDGSIDDDSIKSCGALVATPGRVATGMLVRRNGSALRLGGRLAGPNPIDYRPIQLIYN
jgi:hypothetical protein